MGNRCLKMGESGNGEFSQLRWTYDMWKDCGDAAFMGSGTWWFPFGIANKVRKGTEQGIWSKMVKKIEKKELLIRVLLH